MAPETVNLRAAELRDDEKQGPNSSLHSLKNGGLSSVYRGEMSLSRDREDA
jgi:hypothetical protein